MLKKNHLFRIRSTYFVLLCVYLVLMMVSSMFLLAQQNKIEGLKFGSNVNYFNQEAGKILQENIDEHHQITDLKKLKRAFIPELTHYSTMGIEIALFSKDYTPLLHTKDSWVCSFTEYDDGNTCYQGYAYLNPSKWFSEKEIKELENYITAEPNPKRIGDLANYSISLNGFFLDGDEINPTEIIVTPLYATEFDENGDIMSSSGYPNQDGIVYHANNHESPTGLTFFKYGSIHSANQPVKSQKNLRDLVLDQEKLRKAISSINVSSSTMVNPVAYRYYTAIPYQNWIYWDEINNQSYSEFWTVCATEVNVLKQCSSTLVVLWACSLIPFLVAGWALSAQTHKIYQNTEHKSNNASGQE